MKGSNTPLRNAPPERTRFKLQGRSVALDRRVHAARGDLADLSLAGTLFSAHYARAVPLTCGLGTVRERRRAHKCWYCEQLASRL